MGLTDFNLANLLMYGCIFSVCCMMPIIIILLVIFISKHNKQERSISFSQPSDATYNSSPSYSHAQQPDEEERNPEYDPLFKAYEQRYWEWEEKWSREYDKEHGKNDDDE